MLFFHDSEERGPICKQVENLLTEFGFSYEKVDVCDDLKKWCEIKTFLKIFL